MAVERNVLLENNEDKIHEIRKLLKLMNTDFPISTKQIFERKGKTLRGDNDS